MNKLPLLFLSLLLPVLLVVAVVTEEGLAGLSTLVVPALIIIMLVIFNGLFVAAEFALIGVRPTQVEHIVNEGNHKAEPILTVLRSPNKKENYIATAQVGVSVASLGLGMYGEPQISDFIEPYLARMIGIDPHNAIVVTIGYISAVSLLTYLHIVVGEMVPKTIALSAPARAVLAIDGFMHVMQFIFTLPVRFLNKIGWMVLKLLHIPPAERHSRLHSLEELELIVAESAKSGALNEAEEEMIRNIFSFAERQVGQVMTPRPKIQAIPHDIPLPKLLAMVAESKYSRFPVYKEDLDHTMGVLHLKDLVYQHTRLKGNFDIRLFVRSATVVPEQYPVEKLLAAFKRQRMHMAIVLDEFGGMAGVVTLEDLVEEVVGEVRDEFDEEREPLVQPSPGLLEVDGSYLIDDLRDYIWLGKEDELPAVETVGGLIIAKLERLPQVEDKVTYHNNIHFTIISVDGMAVARVRIEYPVSDADKKVG